MGRVASAGVPQLSCSHFSQELPHLVTASVTLIAVKLEIQASQDVCCGSRFVNQHA